MKQHLCGVVGVDLLTFRVETLHQDKMEWADNKCKEVRGRGLLGKYRSTDAVSISLHQFDASAAKLVIYIPQ